MSWLRTNIDTYRALISRVHACVLAVVRRATELRADPLWRARKHNEEKCQAQLPRMPEGEFVALRRLHTLQGSAVCHDLFQAVYAYVMGLTWCMQDEPAVSWVELAVDFGLQTGALARCVPSSCNCPTVKIVVAAFRKAVLN
eukprot:6985423-Alexandrium_andersonii.AAC.1